MGGKRLRRPTDGGERRPPTKDPLIELFSVQPKDISVSGLFGAVDAFSQEKRKQRELLMKAEKAIDTIYQSFTPAQRVSFFAMLYDRFSKGYDSHMEETGHYRAIRRCLQFAMPYLRTPILDITAGTGEPLLYALDFMDVSLGLGRGPLDMLVPRFAPYEASLTHSAFANEISERMLGKARMKLAGMGVGFISNNAYELPKELKGKFNTVLCAQTFHLVSDDDKTMLVRSMRDALAPGGIAIVLEEDPFRITQSVYIDSLSLFLRAVVRPVKPDILVGRFEVGGLTKLEDSAISPIDSEHAMRLHIFANVTQV
jgi:SAM-dependent methyltransferase